MASGQTQSGPKSPFLAFSGEDSAATLKVFTAAHNWPESCIHTGDIATATEYLKGNKSPQLLLVEIPSAEKAPDLIDKLADVCEPDTKVIVVGHVNEYSFYCWLTEIGIFSYLLKPLTQQMLENAYQKSLNKPGADGKTEKPPAKIISVIGARGGVGTTTLAINLAGLIAENPALQVALVDADPQDGSIALTLDIEPSRGVREALERPERIDGLFIERVMSKIGRLSVMSAEESMQDRIDIHETSVPSLVAELQSKFDVVVMDVGRPQSSFARQCLAASNHVILVGELSLLSLRDTLRVSDLLRETLKLQPPVVIANRVGIAPKHTLPQVDFEKGISAKVAGSVAFAPDLFMEGGPSIAAVKNKNHTASKALQALAEQLVPEMKDEEAKPKKGFSLFSKKKE